MTQHEHGPYYDEDQPTGFVAGLAVIVFGVAVLAAIILVLLLVGA